MRGEEARGEMQKETQFSWTAKGCRSLVGRQKGSNVSPDGRKGERDGRPGSVANAESASRGSYLTDELALPQVWWRPHPVFNATDENAVFEVNVHIPTFVWEWSGNGRTSECQHTQGGRQSNAERGRSPSPYQR